MGRFGQGRIRSWAVLFGVDPSIPFTLFRLITTHEI